MNVQINKLVKSLLQKDTLDQCSVAELKQFAERHPYFGAAQLLLTKKLQTENDDQYNEQLQKTFLFFHNPLWVEQLLNESGTVTITKAENNVPENSAIHSIANETIIEPEVSEFKSEDATIDKIELPIDIPTLKSESTEIKTDETEMKELIFEPFHTVDYFASQGIKFREDEKPVDKFGLQLKSFTDWLKTMKRLPVSEISNAVEPKTEEKVDQMAEHSLTDKEVLTETMAEVWLKQGNVLKAIEIYSKLSLLDPSKIAYFAPKIEGLKKRI